MNKGNNYAFEDSLAESLTSSSQIKKEQRRIWITRMLFILGLLALLNYFSWWLIDEHYKSPLLILLFIAAAAYAGIQLLGNWILYLFARFPEPAPPPKKPLSVDVYVTAYHEPFDLIQTSLKAACEMKGAHTTYLLDDGDDPKLAALAQELGAGYLTRPGAKDAKAGNINAALARTSGDIIVIFDVDHVAKPDFLAKSLGHFNDPETGFVQVMLTFDNEDDSWVARAAIETSLEYYNPTSLGAFGVGGTTLMGSNALIRRKALESIGGYQPGLAEDLATSITLQAVGWKSNYVPKPLAPGMAPPNFAAWFTQQLKWARGVFELLITAYPKLFTHLTWGQRLSYAVRMTKYWIGPAVAFHLLATILVLIFGDFSTRAAFHEYLIKITPLVLIDSVFRFVGLLLWRQDSVTKTSFFRAAVLVYSTWPVYLQAWLMAIFRFPLSFRPTPKTKSGRPNPLWLLPQFTAVILLFVGLVYTIHIGGHSPSLLIAFVILQGTLQFLIFIHWMYSEVIQDSIEEKPTSKQATE